MWILQYYCTHRLIIWMLRGDISSYLLSRMNYGSTLFNWQPLVSHYGSQVSVGLLHNMYLVMKRMVITHNGGLLSIWFSCKSLMNKQKETQPSHCVRTENYISFWGFSSSGLCCDSCLLLYWLFDVLNTIFTLSTPAWNAQQTKTLSIKYTCINKM